MDFWGGCPQCVKLLSLQELEIFRKELGEKILIEGTKTKEALQAEDIEKYIHIDELKNETVTNEASKQRWIDLLNRLSDDEQIIAIATLK